MRKWILGTLGALALTAATAMAPLWRTHDIATAAAPYEGAQLNVIFLDRPEYRAIIKLLPEFEQKTGIKVNYEIVPYEKRELSLRLLGQSLLLIAQPSLDRVSATGCSDVSSRQTTGRSGSCGLA